ncbi:MAG: ribosome maturation factor RimM [Bacillota bacterium]|nr:ribosome maturation factor RimM [Bacillota bacterium]
MPATGRITIGEVTRPHGVRGEVRVRPLTTHRERFLGLGQVYVGGVRRRVRGVRLAGDEVILSLEGAETRAQAGALRGQLLEVDPEEVFPLPEGEYYWFQLRGLRVLNREGREVGTVVDVEPNPAHDLLVVEGAGRRFLVPAVRALVAEIDLAGGRLVINDIPGLLE